MRKNIEEKIINQQEKVETIADNLLNQAQRELERKTQIALMEINTQSGNFQQNVDLIPKKLDQKI